MDTLASLSRYDLLAAALQAGLVSLALGTAVIYLVKRSGRWSANVFFAVLLVAFALSITTLVLEHLALTARYPRLRYVPIWLTWTIGPAWFYYVKFSVFPTYRWRWTDAKHFAFPLLQAGYYTVVFFGALHQRTPGEVFGVATTTLDEGIFLGSVLGYLFAAYRYLRYRAREIGAAPLRWDYWKVRLLRNAQRILILLLAFNFVFVAWNYTTERAYGIGLLHLRSFYASSSLSFGLILLYLLRGVAYRQHFYPQVPPAVALAASDDLAERFRAILVRHHGYRDPDLHRVRLARSIGAEPATLDELARAESRARGLPVATFDRLVTALRKADVLRYRRAGLALREAVLQAGFGSQRVAVELLGGRR